MEYEVDFNLIRELQSIGVREDDLLNLIKAGIFLIKFFSRLFYI